MIGQILAGHYEVQRRLGKQTGRQTLLARDLRTGELVVVKLLFLGSDFEWQDLKLFEREAETLKALSHPAIPRYLDYLEIDEPDNKVFALVQSYIEGKTLEEHLVSGRTFRQDDVKELAKNLLEILAYLHDCQPPVIHRDIKPSNILLTNRSAHSIGQVYLVDFGSVQTIAAHGGTITVVGTYGYMPPEQFGDRATPASDLYSLGATLIYLVTGRHPTELPQKDFRIQFQQVANIPPTFADWLEWMTEPSLDKRLTSAREALEALEKPRIRTENDLAIATSRLKAYAPPPGSEFLKKTADFVEIILPAKGFGFGTIALISALTPLLFWFPEMFSTWGIVTYIFELIFGLFLVRQILFALFKRIRLRIDGQQISLTHELLGLRWKRCQPARREDISELLLIGNRDINLVNGDRVWNHRLVIQAGDRKYKLSRKDGLTKSELNWLANELSNWLGLPITRK